MVISSLCVRVYGINNTLRRSIATVTTQSIDRVAEKAKAVRRKPVQRRTLSTLSAIRRSLPSKRSRSATHHVCTQKHIIYTYHFESQHHRNFFIRTETFFLESRMPTTFKKRKSRQRNSWRDLQLDQISFYK